MGSNPSQLAAINSVPQTATFNTNQLVIVPVTCSCSGQYYQSNTSYVVQPGESFFLIANDTLQGLSTCQAIRNGNSRTTVNIFPGQRLNVPLRCACPTRNQTGQGINYILSYSVTWGDMVSTASSRFDGDTNWTLQANGLTQQSATIFPFTTLLIPLQNPPSSIQTVSPPPPPASPPPPVQPSTPGSSSSKTWVHIIAGVVGGIVATLAIVGIVVYCLRFRRRKVKLEPTGTSSESFEAAEKKSTKNKGEERLSSIAHSIQVYTFEEVVAATDNFSPKCLIKGSVYRGKINGDLAAIKKMDGDVTKEINLLNKINHSNLIRLSGVCFNDGNWYLVYEFAANGALSDWIYSSTNGARSWSRRLQIALDIANGLHYLHNFTEPPYVHKDISSSNILLDADLRAKIANFSLARSAEVALYASSSIRVAKGAKGYLAPEYVEYGLVIPEIDVYAFGVVLLELVTRKEAVFLEKEREVLLSEAIVVILSGEHSESALCDFVDPGLHPKQQMVIVLRMMKLILACLAKEPEDRPSMGEIVSSLSKIQLDVYRSEFMYCSSS
ncbi:unnamed protein product [Linum tenue]|uniref:LysM domain receptor-like kinase 4 n=1 Tax=Linum tenue TaxID=586396 RepID=A0AAV0R9S7_9ROSI|nr:unnamed protein product [Linum tenue]